jgi:4-diphosphocytidyl-2-C-methyl-D-erythritol kinase
MRQDRLTLKAPAKINLYLKVTGQRADGYHCLETLMQKVALYDELELQSCAAGIHLQCAGRGIPHDRGNLVYRAAEVFLQAVEARRSGSVGGVKLALTKRIPVAAGLGGGSSDAAATLKGLNQLYGCGCADEELATMGLRLGADVPFFLADAPAAVATGIGEILTPVAPLSGHSVLLVNPGFSVSTRWVYQTFALTRQENGSNLKNSQEDVDGSLATASRNDLEVVTARKYPEIERLKAELLQNGAVQALMSGSGPTVFGLFADRRRAETCRAVMNRRFAHTYLVDPVQ